MTIYSEPYHSMQFDEADPITGHGYLDFVETKPQLIYDQAGVDVEDHASKVEILTSHLATILSREAANDEDHQKAIQQIIHLFHETDKQILKALSLYLCEIKSVPERIIRFLAESDVSVAEPILQKSPCLSEKTMMSLINIKDKPYWQIMAQRADLTELVITALAKCRDILTSHHLLKNSAINLPREAFQEFIALTASTNIIANLMAQREDLPKSIALDIYWKVSKALRTQLSRTHRLSKKSIKFGFREALKDFNDRANTQNNRGEKQPSPLMWELAYQFRKQGKIKPSTLVKILYDGRVRFFVAMFAVHLNISYEHVLHAMAKPGGRILTVMCKASGFKKEDFISLFLKARSSLPSNKPVDSDELHRAILVFDQLSVEKARQILSLTK